MVERFSSYVISQSHETAFILIRYVGMVATLHDELQPPLSSQPSGTVIPFIKAAGANEKKSGDLLIRLLHLRGPEFNRLTLASQWRYSSETLASNH